MRESIKTALSVTALAVATASSDIVNSVRELLNRNDTSTSHNEGFYDNSLGEYEFSGSYKEATDYLREIHQSHDRFTGIHEENGELASRIAEQAALTRGALGSSERALNATNLLDSQVTGLTSTLSDLTVRAERLSKELTELKSGYRELALKGDLNDQALEGAAKSLFVGFSGAIKDFMAITDEEVALLVYQPLEVQIDRLSEMYDRTTHQLRMAGEIISSLNESELYHGEDYQNAFAEITVGYGKLLLRNNQLLENRIELSKQHLIQSMMRNGVSKECAEFYYDKVVLIASLDTGVSIIKEHIEDSELRNEVLQGVENIKEQVADITYNESAIKEDALKKFDEEAAGFYKLLATKVNGNITLGAMQSRSKAGIVVTVATEVLMGVLESAPHDRRETFEGLQKKAYKNCTENAQSKVQDELSTKLREEAERQFKEQTGQDLDDVLNNMGNLPPETKPSGPSISSTTPNMSDNAKSMHRAAAEDLATRTKECCDKYNAGAIEKCNGQVLGSEEAVVIDNLRKSDALDYKDKESLERYNNDRGYPHKNDKDTGSDKDSGSDDRDSSD